MSANKCRVLVLNWKADALMSLQRILDSDVEATITWDKAVLQTLVNSTQFDVILAGQEDCVEHRQMPTRSSARGPKQRTLRKAA